MAPFLVEILFHATSIVVYGAVKVVRVAVIINLEPGLSLERYRASRFEVKLAFPYCNTMHFRHNVCYPCQQGGG